MKILIACEESQTVCTAFRLLGHEAYSCDILPCSGGHPEWHIQDDVLKHLNNGWDMMIAHPPCTYLSYAGTGHWNKPGRAEKRDEAVTFFMSLINAPIEKICVENPLGYMSKVYRKYDQIIHPYYWGEQFQKRTCLWLKNLPLLLYDKTKAIKPKPLYTYTNKNGKKKRINWVDGLSGSTNAERQRIRSKTFQGIANAMALQWGLN